MNNIKAPLTKHASVLFLALTCSVTNWCCASAPSAPAGQTTLSGPVNFAFTRSMAPIYDLTGSYQFDQQALAAGGAPLDLRLGFFVQQDAAGRLRGSGVTKVLMGTNVVTAQYIINGAVSGGGGKATRAKLSIRWLVQDAAVLANGPVSISVQYNLDVSQGFLNGTARGRAKSAKARSAGINTSVSAVPLPAGVDGSWRLSMNIQTPVGSGSIILPNRRSLQANLTGSFSARSGVGRLKLSGTGGDRGSTLNINLATTTGGLQSLTGKVLGQTVSLKNLGGSINSQSVSQGSAPSQFAGSQACLECHTPIQQTLNKTRHAQVGTQCENCHGPAANHAANDYDPLSRPLVDTAGTLCGACHSGPQHPIYEEWKTSGHATVVGDMNPATRISSCGRCHSGSVRVSLVDGTPLPVGGANVPLGCPTCHQPHELTGLPDQLRNPLYSTNDYFLTTSSVFKVSYDPSVNLCAQCHNHRGAAWTISSEPPHRSPQYNILLGTIGELASGPAQYGPSYHALYIPNQCVGCHMQSAPYVSPAQPAITGHTFAMNSYGVCADCHGSAVNASNLVVFVSGIITNQIQTLQASLNRWATTKAPAILGTAEYGTRAWEYTTPGALSPGGPGPTATQQTLIPVTIQKARFNLYLVLYDGSLGVHNPEHSLTLLETAQTWVDQALQ
jgi:hypothetical protein